MLLMPLPIIMFLMPLSEYYARIIKQLGFYVSQAAVNLRIALVWTFTQRAMVIPNRRFETTCLSQNVGNKLPPLDA